MYKLSFLMVGCSLASFYSAAQAAPLYPQRALNAPQATSGYDIQAERDWTAAPKPTQQPPVSTVGRRPSVDTITFENEPETHYEAVDAPAGTPTRKPIEERPITDTLGSAVGSFNEDVTYSGNIEAGLQYSTGNTETQDFNAAGELIRDSRDWTNRGSFSVASAESEGEQTEEEYRAELESNYKLSLLDFLFAEAEYVDDRFSGYDYRIKEVLGYGRHWYKGDDFAWSSKAGGGYQHVKEKDGERDDSPLARLENNLEWQIAEKLFFENTIQADFSDLTVLRTESALKNQLIGQLFLKLALVTEYLSDVPAGNEKLDTDTTLNLSYEF